MPPHSDGVGDSADEANVAASPADGPSSGCGWSPPLFAGSSNWVVNQSRLIRIPASRCGQSIERSACEHYSGGGCCRRCGSSIYALCLVGVVVVTSSDTVFSVVFRGPWSVERTIEIRQSTKNRDVVGRRACYVDDDTQNTHTHTPTPCTHVTNLTIIWEGEPTRNAESSLLSHFPNLP